jgi:hypothetical protein
MIQKIVILALVGYFGLGILFAVMDSMSVTGVNVILGIIMLMVSVPMMMAGIMANDSGRNEFSTLLMQFLCLSYPFVYLVGLVSSIAVLYSDVFEGQQDVAFWLASMSGFYLLIIIIFFGSMLIKEKMGS